MKDWLIRAFRTITHDEIKPHSPPVYTVKTRVAFYVKAPSAPAAITAALAVPNLGIRAEDIFDVSTDRHLNDPSDI